jgi:hypothetical protein
MVDHGSSVRLLSDLVRVAGRDQANLSLADVATAAHVARGYVCVHHIEHGLRWPTQRQHRANHRGGIGRRGSTDPSSSTWMAPLEAFTPIPGIAASKYYYLE